MLAMEPRNPWVFFFAHNEHVYIHSPAFTCLLLQRSRPGGFLSGMWKGAPASSTW